MDAYINEIKCEMIHYIMPQFLADKYLKTLFDLTVRSVNPKTEDFSSTTHSTYKGLYPFQTGPMQIFYRILTSMDPMHVLLTVI